MDAPNQKVREPVPNNRDEMCTHAPTKSGGDLGVGSQGTDSPIEDCIAMENKKGKDKDRGNMEKCSHTPADDARATDTGLQVRQQVTCFINTENIAQACSEVLLLGKVNKED